MDNQYLKYIVLLERTLASFYGKIKEDASFSMIKTVLEFMETHSDGHAEMIAQTMETNQRPELDPREIVDFQNSVMKDVGNFLKNEDDPQAVLDKLAYSEEALGDYYKKIAGKLQELSDHYAAVSKLISNIGDDEYNHRDILLNDKERLKKREM